VGCALDHPAVSRTWQMVQNNRLHGQRHRLHQHHEQMAVGTQCKRCCYRPGCCRLDGCPFCAVSSDVQWSTLVEAVTCIGIMADSDGCGLWWQKCASFRKNLQAKMTTTQITMTQMRNRNPATTTTAMITNVISE